MGRPLGSENKDKPFREALRLELAAGGEDMRSLRLVARALISEASQGNIQAVKEIADRLDGKAPQSITGEDGGPLTLVLKSFVLGDS